MPNTQLDFSDLLQHGNVVFFECLMAPGWPLTYVSPNVIEILGMSAHDILSGQKTVVDLIHPDDQDKISHFQPDENGVLRHGDIRALDKDGEVVWVEDCLVAQRNDEGKVTGFKGYFFDISSRKNSRLKLMEQTRKLNATLDNMQQGIAQFDPDLKLTSWNRRYGELMDYPVSLLREGTPFEAFLQYNFLRGDYDYLGDEGRLQAVGKRLEQARAKEPHRYERRGPKGGDLEVIGSPLPDGGFVTTYTDISEKKASEREVHNQLAFLNTLINTIPSPIFYKDTNGLFQGCNRAFERMIGIRSRALVGLPWHEIVPNEEALQNEEDDHRLLEGEKFRTHEDTLTAADGRLRNVIMSKSVYPDASGHMAGLVGVITDITEMKEMEKKLRRLALTDPLTGAANRRHFLEVADNEHKRAKRNGENIALVLLDIDHFKKVNDTFGHNIGDDALKALVTHTQECLREVDCLGRFGGEEFVCILPDTDLEAAHKVAERIRHKIADIHIATNQGALRFTVSLGVALWQYDQETLEIAISHADEALYQAKNSGRNRTVVYGG